MELRKNQHQFIMLNVLGIVSQSRNGMICDDDFAPNNHEFQLCFQLPKTMYSIAKIHIIIDDDQWQFSTFFIRKAILL